MSFYQFVQELKEENPNKVIFVKTGAFFNCIGKDAIIAENVLGLRRTCFAKGLCKCGWPVKFVREKKAVIDKKVKEQKFNIIIYDEMEDGKYEYNGKKYGILYKHEGEKINNTKEINCKECNKNIYSKDTKDTNVFTIKREEFENIKNEIKYLKEEIDKIYQIILKRN